MDKMNIEKIERLDYPYLGIGENTHKSGHNKIADEEELERLTY